MDSAGCRHGATENGRRRAAPDAVAMMRSLEVVELHEPVQAVIERRPAGEVVPAKDHAPVLGETGLLQALHEAVGPGGRGLIRVGRMPSAAQAAANSALNSPPPSVSTRFTDQPACRTAGTTTVRKKAATAAAESSGRIRATPYELATSHAVTCHTLPTPLSLRRTVKGIRSAIPSDCAAPHRRAHCDDAPTHQGDERSPVHQSSLTLRSLDEFVGPQQQRMRNRQPERFGGLEVDNQLELGGLLDVLTFDPPEFA